MATRTPDIRSIEFGARFIAIGICFVNLGLVFRGDGEAQTFLALALVGAVVAAIGIYFYWGERWAVPDPTPMEIANTGCLVALVVITGVGAFAVGRGLTEGIVAALGLALAIWLGFRMRAHIEG